MIRIVVMDPTYLDKVVGIHLKAFPRFFLSLLGSEFLRVLYEETLRDPSGIGFVAVGATGLCGFVVGTDSPAGYYRRLLYRRWWRFGAAALWPILRCPSLVPRLLNAFKRPREASGLPDACELMSIAVDPTVQGGGAGRALVAAFVEETRRRGRRLVLLTTDEEENGRVNRFYESQGFQIARVIRTAQGRRLNEYRLSL
jgi:ribosomal protein S18 acetylase RimI-like enzyme